MIKPKLTGTRVVFGPVRLCYVHLLERYKFDGDAGEGKFSTNILIPKSETATIEAIRKAIATATVEAKSRKWGGKNATPTKANPLYDGDDKGDVFAGHYFLNAKSDRRPQVVDRNMTPLTDEEDVYSGMWALVSVTFFGYSTGGNGIGCLINNVQKIKDDERIGGGPGAESDFGDISAAELDDDDL